MIEQKKDLGISRASEDTNKPVKNNLFQSIEAAGREAAIEDGIILPGGITLRASEPKPQDFRRGKWTPEEEAYSIRLIQEFQAGALPLNDGTTLRTFLSKLLNCDPMRISKKFVGKNSIGKVSKSIIILCIQEFIYMIFLYIFTCGDATASFP